MKTVKTHENLKEIYINKLCYFNEYKIIKQEEHILYTNDAEDSFAIVQQYPYGIFISLIHYDEQLLSEIINLFENQCNEISVSIQNEPEEKLNINEISKLLMPKKIYKSFAYDGIMLSCGLNNHVRLLNKNDECIVKAFPEEIRSNELQLTEAFSEFVLNDNGEIFAYFDNDNNMIGYLSCCPEIDNIWDVVYIYVLPKNRSAGIGQTLAAQYLLSKRQRDQIPYYSGVTNPASEAAALKAGFFLCGLRYYYSYEIAKI